MRIESRALLQYGALKLKRALEKFHSARTPQEGLYEAFLDDIQCLSEEPQDFPDHLTSAIRLLTDELTRQPGPDPASRARATISRLTPEEGEAIADLLVAIVRWLESGGADTSAPGGLSALDSEEEPQANDAPANRTRRTYLI